MERFQGHLCGRFTNTLCSDRANRLTGMDERPSSFSVRSNTSACKIEGGRGESRRKRTAPRKIRIIEIYQKLQGSTCAKKEKNGAGKKKESVRQAKNKKLTYSSHNAK